jgi:hypothetical protein
LDFSLNAVSSAPGLAAVVRFAATGMIDVQDAKSFAAQAAFPYKAGIQYHFHLVIKPGISE